MDNLPVEILIRIFDKSRLSDQLISHRLINNKCRSFIPTSASRIQRVNTTDLVAISKKLALFSQKDSAYYYHSRSRQNIQNLREDVEVERAYANLLLYFCNLVGSSLKCISFTTPLFLGSATMEKLAIMCPHIIEINVGYTDSRLRCFFGGDVQVLFINVQLALPRFPELKILRIISDDGDTRSAQSDMRFLQPIVSQLRLQKLRTAGHRAPIFTADPNLLEELVIQNTSPPYKEIKNRICEVFPNLRRHYLESKQYPADKGVRPGEAKANYRRLHMLRGSSWIGSSNLWFIDERLFLDFPCLQRMYIEISDDGSCDRFIRALQSSRNWRALNIYLSTDVSIETRTQLLQALFYTTAERLKKLTLRTCFESLGATVLQQFLRSDQAGCVVIFGKILRQCEIDGLGGLLFAAKIANDCSRLKSLTVKDFAEYMQPELGLQELLQTTLAYFKQTNLRSLLKLNLNIEHSTAYDLIQRLRGSRLHTLQLSFTTTDRNISADAHCLSLLREDLFPYLRKIKFTTDNKVVLSDLMLNILRNLPALQWLTIVLLSRRIYNDTVPTVQLDQAVWQHIADHANLLFCRVESPYIISSMDTFASLFNAIIARKKVDENGRMLPWLCTVFERWYRLREPRDDQHPLGDNACCIVTAS